MLSDDDRYTALISPEILTRLEHIGIKDFYPPQWDALKVGLKGKNLIALDSIDGFTPQYVALSFGGD